MPNHAAVHYEGIEDPQANPFPENTYLLNQENHSSAKIRNAAMSSCQLLDKVGERIKSGGKRRELLQKVITHINLKQTIEQDGSPLAELAARIQDAVAPIVGVNVSGQTRSIFDLAGNLKQEVLKAIENTWSKTLDLEMKMEMDSQAKLQKNFDLFIELLKAEAHRISTIAKHF